MPKKITSMLVIWSFVMIMGCERAARAPDPSVEMWNAELSASRTADNSPSKLYVRWNPVGDSGIVSHYVITAVEMGGIVPIAAMSIESGMDATISGLKPATAYTISLKACKDEDCSRYLSADSSIVGRTP